MNAKTIYVLSLTCLLLIIFSVGGVFISRLIGQRNKKVMLVVAKHDYPKGTTITDPEQMFELREFLEADGPFVAFENLDEVSQDFVLIDDIREGQPLTRKSVAFRIAKALMDLTSDDPPGPGRAYWAIIDAKAHQGSIRVGSRVDVIDKDPNGESKIVFHDVVVRYVMAASKNLQEILDEEGKKGWVALEVIVDTSREEVIAYASRGHRATFLELRPTADNKKKEEKNSSKVP